MMMPLWLRSLAYSFFFLLERFPSILPSEPVIMYFGKFLNTKGVGAFWNLYGSMHEIELPAFVLLNVTNQCYAEINPEMCDRMRKAITKKAAEWLKRKQSSSPPKPSPACTIARLEAVSKRGVSAVYAHCVAAPTRRDAGPRLTGG